MKRRILLAIAVFGVGLVVAIVLFVTRDDGDHAVASTRPPSSTSLEKRSDRTRPRSADRNATTGTTGSGATAASVADLVTAHAGGATLAAAPAHAYSARTD